MEIILTVLIALVVGFVVYLLCSLFSYTARYAQPAGLIAALLTLLVRLGVL